MPAYVISEVKVLDEDLIASYRAQAQASIEKYGGRYLVRAGALELIEGARDRDRQYIIVEFPSMARARQWYGSPEYAEALKVRAGALDRTLVFIEGVEPA
ncbi:MAG: DUF1330 domain-containing protein [Rhodopseudomonas sp.]|nr:DUF1330 domain-containing protein [Rhodopseudomonas sp.]